MGCTTVVRRTAAVLVATGALTLGVATAASAHALLESTTPAAGSVGSTSPSDVTLRFGEPVETRPTAIRVYDDHLRRVDRSDAGHLTGRADTVGVRLKPDLATGTYTVVYRVLSSDSHPVAGGFTFSVRAPSKVLGVAAGLGGGPEVVGIALGAARFVEYAGMAVGLGGLVFFVLWPPGRRDRTARHLVFGGLATLLVGAAASFVLEVPYVAGERLGTVFDGRMASIIATSHLGIALTMRMIVVAVVLVLYRTLLSRGTYGYSFSVAGIAVALADTFADAGHSSINDNYGLALLSDGAHVLAMSVWLGGLVVLATVVLRQHPDHLRSLLPRFSVAALTCIVVLIGTGTYQAVRNVGYWPALPDTAYGRLVLAKIGGVIAIVGLGYLARRLVVEHYPSRPLSDGPGTLAVNAPATALGAPALSMLRRGLAAEIVTGVAVLSVTSVLVATLPGRSAYSVPVSRTFATSTFRLDVQVDPAKTGPAVVRVHGYPPIGKTLVIQQVTGSLRLPAGDVGPLPISFTIVRPGYAIASITLAAAGIWQLVITVQTSPIDATTVATTITVN